MVRKLRVLFAPIDATGHVNAAIGMAQELLSAGHEVTFVVNEQWMGRLKPYGIREILLKQEDRDVTVLPSTYWAEMLIKTGILGSDLTPLEKTIKMFNGEWDEDNQELKRMDRDIEAVLNHHKPDVVICDQLMEIPSVVWSGIPWVLVCSCNPLWGVDDDRTPPPDSGLPAIGPKSEWKAFRDTVLESRYKMWQRINDYVMSRGVGPLRDSLFINESKYLNIYGFPLELDYLDMRPLPPNWYRFDNLKRTDSAITFEIPVPLRDRPGKLIYFSMGSMGGADVMLMKRLVAILAKSKHRFIVSKGPGHESYELADNMWGQQTVPQIQVLPLVDLVVTHGGNNTITETCYYGKPMIVLPLFADQYDNAQRVHEKGFGIRLDAYKCSEEELLNAIEKLLNDNQLNDKLKKMSQRIQSDNSIAKLPKIIENLVFKRDENNYLFSNK